MKKSLFLFLLLCAATIVSCDDEDNAIPQAILPDAEGLQQVWSAAGSVFDLDGDGACYLLDDTSDDGFAHTPDGDYISISVREYCEQFAADWNADPKNADNPITAEEAADRRFVGLFTRFNISADLFVMEQGAENGYSATLIQGSYTYNENTGVITVEDTIDSATKELVVSVDKEGTVNFLCSTEWYAFDTSSYDKTRTYWIKAPTRYYCPRSGK